MDEAEPITYHRDALSGPELQRVVDDILAGLRNAEDLDALAASAGLTADDVRTMSVRISESESSIDPATAFILVHLAGGAVSAAGGGAATVFWKKVVLPRVRQRKGGDAIGEEEPDAE
jgi:hypothetical protein